MINHSRLSAGVLSILISSSTVACIEGVDTGNINIVSTGGYEGTSSAEPHKVTTLSISTKDKKWYDVIKWHVNFKPVNDEIWPDYQQELLADEVAGHVIVGNNTNGISTIDHMFRLPGAYEIKVIWISTSTNGRQIKAKIRKSNKASKSLKIKKFSKAKSKSTKKWKKETKQEKKKSTDKLETILVSSEVRVRYARRDVIDLLPSDWDNYVEAIWTLKELSSGEGKKRFNCSNFYNIDVFTTMHGVLSADKRCDQNHLSLMQENAHHAWMTLLEKSLQCVHPSIAMPFYNVAKDWRKYYNPDEGIKSMLKSPMFGSDYYGGGFPNYDDREDPYDPYYIEDGRFAKFPLRQNRTELCDESTGIFDDEYFLPLCKEIMEEGKYPAFRNNDPTKSGIWLREPRDESSYKYVSARRWHIYDGVGDKNMEETVPQHEMIEAMKSKRDVVEQYRFVSGLQIHGYAHTALSGLWGGSIDETTLSAATAAVGPNTPILDNVRSSADLLPNLSWSDFLAREAGCFVCNKYGCSPDTVNFVSKNCYNNNNNYQPLNTVTERQPFWTEGAEKGSLWYEIMLRFNYVAWIKFAVMGYGLHLPNTGTFARHGWANQDPMFYPHHAFTFLVNDIGNKNLVDTGTESPPLYGLDKFLEKRGVKECPGNNPTDITVYRNIVRYKVGQEIGSNQSWDHILEMWTEERRDYEWIINDEYITNYDEKV